mmetsp:Transcript_44648/g.129071  ORF Transcript_44648/g.129071 Transcript_44648/m.129071 type:complete len:470 (+) Transcript_44648:144-1553(+)|eukprot:CAMPEP_0176067624 /NCGR_PEP_ID=MMETSP0120_2-20121206/33755_1 /TAXON_ID=160619 /ORGANISM="Kryptoperidinium foliaceum, Strain CCMP 1326" /LENGTH=469 /DNA_ID=CAMNT_0017401243 /DNA_START=133 /DNA_END=1542 /DNA_ORIENTATION=+
MPETVTLPVFGSASNQQATASADEAQKNANQDWQMDSGGDPMDFDLLAEYLLEENPTSAAGIDFDFNDHGNGSTVISPEESVDGGAGVQQMIHQQPNMQQARPPAPVLASLRPAPAPLAPAPSAQAPIAAKPPAVAAQGIAVPGPAGYMQAATHIAPAPSMLPSGGGVNSNVASQPATAVTKRRRVESTSMNGGSNNMVSDPMAVAAALQGRGRKKTQAQIDRRRERNRILARRTRLRKKFFFESLQKEVVDLQRENAALKDIVRSELSGDGQKLLEECDAMERMPQAVLEACGENVKEYEQQDFNLVRSIQQSQHSFIITDPSLQDNPIVFASDDFLNLTGYAREDVLGRNCRFLQGTDTSQEKVDEIRKGLANGDDVSVTLLNYTADGTPFWNKLFIAALRDAQNNIVNYIGVTVKVPGPEKGDAEYGKTIQANNTDDNGDDNEDDDDDDDGGLADTLEASGASATP